MVSVLPIIALIGVASGLFGATLRRTPSRHDFLIPLTLAVIFGVWSAFAVASEGVTGFWAEHIRSAWSNQIWFDLLLAFSMAWLLLLPRMREAGMAPWAWLLLSLLTGSFGLLLTFSRCLFLERSYSTEGSQ